MAFKVTVRTIAASFVVAEDQTIVEAALEHGLSVPFSCLSGTCGTCKARLVSGQVRLLDYSRFTLSDDEREQGLILACCAIPLSDCEVAPLPSSPIPARRVSCTVACHLRRHPRHQDRAA